MHIPWKNGMFAALLLLCLPLAGCGGGGGGGDDAGAGGETTVVSGLATKGPISGALVQINQLTVGGAAGALLGSGPSGTDGRFAIAIPATAAAAPLLVTVTGRADGGSSYLSESTGAPVPFGPSESLRAAAQSGAAAITVSPLTEAACQKLQQILTLNPALASAQQLPRLVRAANARIGTLTGISDILADPAGDIRHRAYLLILDQMIVNLGAGANSATLVTLLSQAFLDVTATPYQTYLQALRSAADAVRSANAGNGALLAAIDQILALAANPPPEPDFSDTTPPTAPRNLRATASALSANAASVVLSWSASSDNDQVAGYEVFRNGAKIATVLTPGYTDTAVSFDVSFSYFVVAFDAAGNQSAASNLATVTPLQPSLGVTVGGQVGSDVFQLPFVDNVAPAAPLLQSALPSALTATLSSVTVTWGAASDNVAVTGYDVFRNGVKVGTVAGTSFTDPSLASGVPYSYTVVAFDAAGNRSLASAALTVTPPSPPLDVTVGGQVQL